MSNFVQLSEVKYENIGLLDSCIKNTISVIYNRDYLSCLKSNNNIIAVITNREFGEKINENIQIVLSEDPIKDFVTLFNDFHYKSKQRNPTKIAETAKICSSAVIANKNVSIGENVTIGSNVVVCEDVVIADDCEIGPGSVIGAENIECRETANGLVNVYHNRSVILERGVRVGANCTIDKGIYERDTIIGSRSQIGSRSLIGHGAHIGENCKIICCTICGSSSIGNYAYIAPGAVVTNKVIVGERATVSAGAVLVTNLSDGERASGNFAVDHMKFMRAFVSNL